MELTTDTTIYVPEEIFDAVVKGIDYSDKRSWIPWAWAALVRAGDVPAVLDDFADDYASHVISYVALGFLYERFQDVYAGAEGDDELMIEALGADRPYITDIDVARYCERHGYSSLEELETGHGLLQEAARNRRTELRVRLRDILGGSHLFTSLAVASRPDDFFDADEAEEETMVERTTGFFAENAFDEYVADVTSDLSVNQVRTYEWLVGSLDLD